MILTSYVFKPKHPQIAEKIIGSFVTNWLDWDECGVYLGFQPLQDGYYKLSAESENPDLERFSETCWREDPVTGEHLANDMMVFLDEEDFFHAPFINSLPPREAEADEAVSGYQTDNPKYYSFHEEELSNIVRCLAQNNSRIVSFWEDRVFLMEKDDTGASRCAHTTLLDHALKMPWPEKSTRMAR